MVGEYTEKQLASAKLCVYMIEIEGNGEKGILYEV